MPMIIAVTISSAHWQAGAKVKQLISQQATACVYCELVFALLFFGLFIVRSKI